MLLPVIFIMAFPGEIMESGLIIHHTEYFIFMLLNSMAAACLQFIWVMVCIPNQSHLSWASEQIFPCKALLWDESQSHYWVYCNECMLCYLKQRLQYRSPSQVWQRRVASWLQMQHQGSSSSSLSDGGCATAAGEILLLGAVAWVFKTHQTNKD